MAMPHEGLQSASCISRLPARRNCRDDGKRRRRVEIESSWVELKVFRSLSAPFLAENAWGPEEQDLRKCRIILFCARAARVPAGVKRAPRQNISYAAEAPETAAAGLYDALLPDVKNHQRADLSAASVASSHCVFGDRLNGAARGACLACRMTH